jgi:uncharacterized coiled-coil protein SlyX
MEDWFRWVLGILNGVYFLVLGWLVNWIVSGQKISQDLDKRITVLETRPHVDPILYTKAIMEMSSAIVALTVKLDENLRSRISFQDDIKAAQTKMQQQLEAIKDELDLLASKVRAVA